MSAAAFDPRLNRVVTTKDGLTRRVNEAERRLNTLSASQADVPVPYIPAVILDGAGPISTAVPPNGTSGTAFTIPRTGRYLCQTATSGKRPTAGLGQMENYIDGVLIATQGFYWDSNVHQTMPTKYFWMDFTATGTHYLWQRAINTMTTDANDFWSFMAMRVAAL